MLVRDVLKGRGTRLFSVKPGTPIRETVDTMVDNKIGAILVVDPDECAVIESGHEIEIGPDGALKINGKLYEDKNVDGWADGCTIGIFTERDNLRATKDRSISLDSATVDDVMTPKAIIVRPSMKIHEAMGLMTEQRIRHLPVVAGDTIVGMVSIGDLVKVLTDLQKAEIEQMKDYISST